MSLTENLPGTTEHALLELFHLNIDQILDGLDADQDLDAVVGIPFHNEIDTLADVIRTARAGIEQMGLAGRAAVLCAGPERARAVFDAAAARVSEDGGEGGVPFHGLFLVEGLDGRGWSLRALMVTATRYRSPLILLPPNLQLPEPGDGETEGFSPRWIERLLNPMKQGQDLALARFSRHPLAQPVESFLAFPVIAAVFGFHLRQPTPGVVAVSQKLVHKCLAATDMWAGETGAYGFDAMLVTRALVEDLSVCEVPLGPVLFRHEVGKLKHVFHQVAHAVLKEVALHDQHWLDRDAPFRTAAVSGPRLEGFAPDYDLVSDTLRRRFKLEFNHFDDTLFRAIIPDDLRERMERQTDENESGILLSAEEWILILRRFLLAYRFEKGFHPDDIVDGLFPFFLARLATFIDEYHSMKQHLSAAENLSDRSIRQIARREAERVINGQKEMFVAVWPEFRESWQEHTKAVSSYLPRLGAWQFIPGVNVIVPQEIDVEGANSVWAYQVYKEQIDLYRDQFKQFISDYLGFDHHMRPADILEGVESFMYRLDRLLDTDVFPFDVSTVDGAQKMADKICRYFCKERCFCLTPEAAEKILLHTPPRGLIMALDAGNVHGLLEKLDARDALGLAAWTDMLDCLNGVLDIIESDGDPDWFEESEVRPAVFDIKHLANAVEVGGSAALGRLAGRMLAANLPLGAGGKFPKLWYMLRAAKAIAGIELFSGIWRGFAGEGFDFGKRVTRSIRGHWGRQVMSAHNAFENMHQRIVSGRLQSFAEQLRTSEPGSEKAADALEAAARVHHLSITLPDATFVPLSAWTWASFSHRGGVGGPTPLSSLVERDWATRDFLTSYLEKTGLGTNESIDKKIFSLIGEGRESDDLREHLFGIEADPDTLVVRQSSRPAPPPAAKMERPLDKPMFKPIRDHAWESRYVLNSAAIRIQDKVYILYRAFGDDEISRIGLVWSKDGIGVDGRLDTPIFEPANETERDGCEDPRVVLIDGRIWMLYTAWDREVAQIALASIDVGDFVAGFFDRWERHGLGFPGLANKDAVLYPEKFNGRYALYHRLDPNMWITYLDDLTCPFPREGQQIILSPRAGMMWDGVKIGAGAQPIKTSKGWLNIYHGVDYERSYRLGVLFTPLDDPARVIYRSPNPVLEPETDYELGDTNGGDSWVPHVVFTCGAVPAGNMEVVGPDDEVLVYYGAADTVMGVARATVRELVPVFDSL
jgi:predicted GH43/DUF377 family glycosyl hydrolase